MAKLRSSPSARSSARREHRRRFSAWRPANCGAPQGRFGSQTWHAWTVEQAKPLDQILKENQTASNVCIPGAVRAMLVAWSRNHILSDNALFNFGMVNDNVVIIDAGSVSGQPEQSRGRFNKKVMTPFWRKAGRVTHQDLVQVRELAGRVIRSDGFHVIPALAVP